MAGLATRLPDALVGLLPHLRSARHLVDQDRPQPLGDVVSLLGVQVDGVEHRAVDVVLALVVGAVADAHRTRPLVALEVIERGLGELLLALDPVHDLQRAVLVAFHVGDVLDEVVGLPVQAQRVQPPQGERRVAHPAEAVVPVALAPGRLRQRRGGRRHEGSGGHEREPLQRQRRTLEMDTPGVIRVGAFRQPRAPEAAGALYVFLRLLHRVRASAPLRPGERAEALLAFAHRVAAVRAVALDAHANVAEQPEAGSVAVDVHAAGSLASISCSASSRHAPFSPVCTTFQLRRRGAVVEHRLAHDLDLHLPLDAFDDAHQQVVGVVVGRRARVAGAVLVVVPRADRERLHHP